MAANDKFYGRDADVVSKWVLDTSQYHAQLKDLSTEIRNHERAEKNAAVVAEELAKSMGKTAEAVERVEQHTKNANHSFIRFRTELEAISVFMIGKRIFGAMADQIGQAIDRANKLSESMGQGKETRGVVGAFNSFSASIDRNKEAMSRWMTEEHTFTSSVIRMAADINAGLGEVLFGNYRLDKLRGQVFAQYQSLGVGETAIEKKTLSAAAKKALAATPQQRQIYEREVPSGRRGRRATKGKTALELVDEYKMPDALPGMEDIFPDETADARKHEERMRRQQDWIAALEDEAISLRETRAEAKKLAEENKRLQKAQENARIAAEAAAATNRTLQDTGYGVAGALGASAASAALSGETFGVVARKMLGEFLKAQAIESAIKSAKYMADYIGSWFTAIPFLTASLQHAGIAAACGIAGAAIGNVGGGGSASGGGAVAYGGGAGYARPQAPEAQRKEKQTIVVKLTFDKSDPAAAMIAARKLRQELEAA